MTNAERFLDSFSEVEKWLRHRLKSDQGIPFYQLVDRAAEGDRGVRRYRIELKEFADLRNAIVHERTDGHLIAEPNVLAVRDIERLVLQLTSPPRVMPAFQRKVDCVDENSPLARVVENMWKGAFSQIPVVRSGRFVALLTANTISRWLGASVKEDLVSVEETSVGQVLEFTEHLDNHTFLPRVASLFDALASFDDFETRGKPLDAILLTENGRATEQIIGIITAFDVPKMLKLLDQRAPRPSRS